MALPDGLKPPVLLPTVSGAASVLQAGLLACLLASYLDISRGVLLGEFVDFLPLTLIYTQQ
jgi:hypothetical protein